MKILQLISSAGFFGAENIVLELSKQLDSLNIESIIGVFENLQNPHTEIAKSARKNNLKAKTFPCKGRLDIRTLYDIEKFVKTNNIDIVHTHASKPNAYGFIVSRMVKKAIVFTCHNRIRNAIVSSRNNWIRHYLSTKYYYRIDRSILRKFDKVIAVSEDIKKNLLRDKIKEDRISLIHNGINVRKFENENDSLRKEFNISNDEKVIGTVARLTEEKGLFIFLQAAKEVLNKHPDVIFMLVGDGPFRNGLERQAEDLRIREKVIFTGIRNDMPAIYSAMDIFVLPSLNEGFPMVLLEAMAAKKPFVATKVGAIPRVIENGKTGILVSPGDIDGLIKAIHIFLEDWLLAKRLSERAYELVKNEFSAHTMTKKYIRIYEEVLRSRGQ